MGGDPASGAEKVTIPENPYEPPKVRSPARGKAGLVHALAVSSAAFVACAAIVVGVPVVTGLGREDRFPLGELWFLGYIGAIFSLIGIIVCCAGLMLSRRGARRT